MKSPIEQAFERAAGRGKTAFIPFFTGGYPDPDVCVDILTGLAETGADVIEVGMPFSDPLADGPTIQASSKIALDGGVTPHIVFDIVARSKKKASCPFVIMTYVNPVFRMGCREFAKRSREAGVSGIIIPDLPPEEADEWLEAAAGESLDTIFLVAPTTPENRMKEVASYSKGFLYYVSMTGVTGSDLALSPDTIASIRYARKVSPAPVAVGFGVSTPAHATALKGIADGVIVGSALIRACEKPQTPGARVEAVADLAASLNQALENGSSR